MLLLCKTLDGWLHESEMLTAIVSSVSSSGSYHAFLCVSEGVKALCWVFHLSGATIKGTQQLRAAPGAFRKSLGEAVFVQGCRQGGKDARLSPWGSSLTTASMFSPFTYSAFSPSEKYNKHSEMGRVERKIICFDALKTLVVGPKSCKSQDTF